MRCYFNFLQFPPKRQGIYLFCKAWKKGHDTLTSTIKIDIVLNFAWNYKYFSWKKFSIWYWECQIFCFFFIFFFNFRKPEVELIQSLQFNRERLTCMYTGKCFFVLLFIWFVVFTDSDADLDPYFSSDPDFFLCFNL